MKKCHRTISMHIDVDQDIKKRILEYNFNFSEWVQREYRHAFMSVDHKKQEIKDLQDQITKLNQEINKIELKQEVYKLGFTEQEKRYFADVPRLLSEGKDWNPLRKRFNLAYHKNLSMEEFKKNVSYYDRNKNKACR